MNNPKPIASKPAWLLVAGAEKAAIYLYDGPKEKLCKHHEITQPLPRTSDIVSDQQGRNKNQQMPGGESYAEPTDPRTHEKREFSKEVAHYLYEHHQEYDILVIAAAPTILGMLRAEFHQEVQDRLTAELDKNLTHYDANELPKHLAEVLLFDTDSLVERNPDAKRYASG